MGIEAYLVICTIAIIIFVTGLALSIRDSIIKEQYELTNRLVEQYHEELLEALEIANSQDLQGL